MRLQWLLWAPPLLAAAGVCLLVQAGLAETVELVSGLRRRVGRRLSRLTLRDRVGGQEREAPGGTGERLLALWVGPGTGLAMALAWHHAVLSPWFLILGGAASWMWQATRPTRGREDLRILETFLSTFRSVFTVGDSVFDGLAMASDDIVDPSESGRRTQLLATVDAAVRQYRSEADRRAALQVLRSTDAPYLNRLAVVLEHVPHSDEEGVQEALRNLEEQVHQARRLQDRMETALTMNRLTLRVLQVANLTALAVVTVLPMWRAYYAAKPHLLVALSGMALAGSWYFGAEMRRMGELL